MHLKALLPTVLFSTFAFTANCPQPLNQNLLVNGGFEQSANSISPWTSTLGEYNIQTPGHNSNQAFHSQYKSHTNGSLTQLLDLCENDTYMVEFDRILRVHSSTLRGNYLNPTIGNMVSSYIESWSFDRNHWKHQKYIVVGNEIPDLNFQLRQRCSHCGFSIDNVQVYAITPPIVNSSAEEIVFNGGFEQSKGGNFDDWNHDKTCDIASPGYKSDHSASCTATDGANGIGASFNQEGSSYFYNGPYIYALDYRVITYDATTKCSITASVAFSYDRQDYSVVGYDSAFTNNTWYHFSIPIFAAGFENPFPRLTVKNQIIGHSCEVYFDNISLKQAYFAS